MPQFVLQFALEDLAERVARQLRGLLAPDPSVLRLSGKFPADPVYAPR